MNEFSKKKRVLMKWEELKVLLILRKRL